MSTKENNQNNTNNIPNIMKNIEKNLEKFSENKPYNVDDEEAFMLDESLQEKKGLEKNFELTSEQLATFKSIIQKIVSEELDKRNN